MSPTQQLRELSLSRPLGAQYADIKLVFEQYGSDSPDRAAIGSCYVYLDRLLLGSPPSEREEHLNTISTILSEWLSETSFYELALAFAALTAIQQTDLQSAVALYSKDGMESRIQDAGEIITMPQKLVEESEYTRAKLQFSLFVAQAAGHSKTAKLAESLAHLSDNYLRHSIAREDEDRAVRAAAMLSFAKLRAVKGQSSASTPDLSDTSATRIGLLEAFMIDAVKAQDMALLAILLELSSIITLKPAGRQAVAARSDLVRAIMTLTQHAQLQFGTASALRNLTSYRNTATQEERTTAQLRQYANSGGKSAEAEEESDVVVDKRNRHLIDTGIVSCILPVCKSTSPVVRSLAGSTLHNLGRAKEHRGLVLQQGGARMLLAVALQAKSQPEAPSAAESAESVQGLAKLLITANPAIVFASGSGGLENAVILLSSLFVASTSTRLQRFEALMALTNIASVSDDLADRTSNATGLLDAIDDQLLSSTSEVGDEGYVLCRRAAIQLLCNIAVSDTVFLRYTAADQADSLASGKLPAAVAGRIQVILALADVEDLETRQAALAVLSQLTYAQTVCSYIAAEDKRFSVFQSGLEDEDPGMRLRAIACLANISKEVPEKQSEIRNLLQRALHDSNNPDVRASAQEILAQI